MLRLDAFFGIGGSRVYYNVSSRSVEPITLVELLRKRAIEHPYQRAYTFLLDGETEEVSVTYSELDRQARAIGALLQTLMAHGERAILLYQPGLDYIAAFFGCLYAGVVAVTAYPPQLNRPPTRLQAIIADSRAKFILTTSQVMNKARNHLEKAPEWAELRWIETDCLKERYENIWRNPRSTQDTLAFLQYTSGSTTTPKGVMLSHYNLLSNTALMQHRLQLAPECHMVSWLPLFHDMGLIGAILEALYCRCSLILMSPTSFLQRPYRWLQAISCYRATWSGGPNFAYDLCLRKITPDQKVLLDLSSWKIAFNGAEPVRAKTLEQFASAFASCGFRREAFYPTYGLAEASLMVTGGLRMEPPVIQTFQRAALEQNQVVSEAESEQGVEQEPSLSALPVPSLPEAQPLVSCGHAFLKQKVIIVDPVSLTQCLPHQVGEIWMSGPGVAQGYWNRPEETEQTFRAYLADSGDGPFLRTGDLGFLHNGELFVNGRLKDLIIIDGRNHYPQDIELSVEQSHPTLRLGCCGAFSVDVDGEEQLVVVAETNRPPSDPETVITSIRQAVAEYHDLRVYAVVLLKAGGLPKTSSGKIQRHACRLGFLSQSLNVWKD